MSGSTSIDQRLVSQSFGGDSNRAKMIRPSRSQTKLVLSPAHPICSFESDRMVEQRPRRSQLSRFTRNEFCDILSVLD